MFPNSFNLTKVSINLCWSRACKPIDGSSSIYRTPDNFDPICVASLILCSSPPANVPAFLDKVKYAKPTSVKNCVLSTISFKIGVEIFNSPAFNFAGNFSKNSFTLSTGNSTILSIDKSFTVTAKTSGFNLLPLHLGQIFITMYCSISWRVQSESVS